MTAVPSPADPAPQFDSEIDITADLCPMTYVRTRLALDRLRPGQVLRVWLRGEEPRRNVPRTAAEQGHAVLLLRDAADGTAELLLRKAQPAPGASARSTSASAPSG